MRIVSLLASGTEIVEALGLEDALVGISHECDWPERLLDRPRLSRPRFDPSGLDSAGVDRAVREAMAEHGSVYEVDADRLEALAPDLVLTQAVCEVCAVPTPGVRDELERRGMTTRVLSLDAHTIAEILESIRQVAAAAGVPERGAELVRTLEARTRRVREAVADEPRPRVLALEWLDPPFAPGHWLPEMVEAAGGECLGGATGSHSRQVTWEDVEGLEPDALVVMPCGYDVAAARRDADAHATELERVAGAAIAAGRAWVVDGSAYFNRSGPRYVDGIEIMAGLLHPARWPAPDGSGAQRWSSAT